MDNMEQPIEKTAKLHPSCSSGRNISVRDLVIMAQDAAKKAAQAQRSSKRHLYDALRIILEIYELQQADAAALESLVEAMKEREIRTDDKRTKNPFVHLAKLIFENSEKPTNISRSAAAVKYAADNGVQSQELEKWIEDKGGVVRCAGLEAAARRAAGLKRPSKATNALQDALAKRREGATPIQAISGISVERTDKLFSILFELDNKGSYVPLGSTIESEQTVRRYLSQELPRRGRTRKT